MGSFRAFIPDCSVMGLYLLSQERAGEPFWDSVTTLPIFRGILSFALENFGQQSEVFEKSVIIASVCCYTYNKEYAEVLEATVKKVLKLHHISKDNPNK